ncbi:GH3 auxin-responsive promoter family protein [Mesorhizobium sp. AR10]|uniref:GH3 family domain-containing protein n=1 Tax=Mesorhizobium sp. AR10 TaxID=2865839 RepID=UPI002160A79C|nr:GH3 auxin-responsive promoter family protein [Mesorhizobium sp. AR10]UVK38670.1 GH3 auxin-responsive promoter family protein [Mesorhizobium sp. AR10]
MGAEVWARIAGATAAGHAGFRARLGHVEATQRALLRRLVEANLPTAFGGDHNFANVTSAESFRDLVPIGDYEALSPYINRVVGGEENVLTAEPVRFLEQTGGSSGGAKYIPYTDTGLQAYSDCLYPWMSDLIARRPGVTRGHSYFALSPVGRSASERVGAHRLGSPVPFAYFGALRHSLIELSAVPMELRLLTDFASWQRQTCLHLLAAEDLALIWVWSPTYLTEILRAMQRDAGSLLPELADRLGAVQPADAARRRIVDCVAAIAVAVPASTFLRVTKGKVVLLSESAMIRAPQSVGVVRLLEAGNHLQRALPKTSIFALFVQKGVLNNEVSAAQVRAARGLLDISQQELADLSKVSLRTIVQFERGSKPASESILQALKLSLEAAGIEFIPENGGGPGVRLSRGTANT